MRWSELNRSGPILLTAIAGFLLLKAAAGMAQDQRAPREEKPPTLCDARHRGSRTSAAMKLGEVRRAYKNLRAMVSKGLKKNKFSGNLRGLLNASHDLKLKSCRREASREPKLDTKMVRRLRGRTLYFVSAPDPDRVRIPKEIEDNRFAEILVVKCRKLRDLTAIAKRLKRRVSLATPELLKALDIRCANSIFVFPKDAKNPVVREMRP